MFDALTDRLSGILDRLTRRGALTEADVAEAMREVRRALLEADVALDVARTFIDRVKERAVGVDVVKSVTPGQMVVKIVHDELVAMLGADAQTISLAAAAPVPILMVGLQGSGKTTSTAKIAYRFTNRDRRKVLMASLDTRRPAAMEQLATLGTQTGVATLPIVPGQSAVQIARRAMEAGRLGGYDVVLLDTAGRTTLDEALMAEVAEVKRAVDPHEVLLVADALTGQDAVVTARAFDEALGVTGIVLTRLDGAGRGGAALSMRAVPGKPIKLVDKFGGLGDAIDEAKRLMKLAPTTRVQLVELPNLGAQADLVAFHGHLDVVLADAGNLRLDVVAFGGLLHVDLDLRGGGERVPVQRLDEVAGGCELLEELIEQVSACHQ